MGRMNPVLRIWEQRRA